MVSECRGSLAQNGRKYNIFFGMIFSLCTRGYGNFHPVLVRSCFIFLQKNHFWGQDGRVLRFQIEGPQKKQQ